MIIDSGTAQQRNYIFILRPFGPRANGNNADVMQDEIESLFGESVPSWASVEFIDTWNSYHTGNGEIHCGSVARRTPSDVYLKWCENWR